MCCSKVYGVNCAICIDIAVLLYKPYSSFILTS